MSLVHDERICELLYCRREIYRCIQILRAIEDEGSVPYLEEAMECIDKSIDVEDAEGKLKCLEREYRFAN